MLLQAADVLRTRRLIPDLDTWTQCFAIYTAVLGTKHPTRVQSLLMYTAVVAKLSKKFKWPSWVIYDHNFRQDAADMGQLDWSKIDGGIYAQCFTGMSLSNEGWCTLCNSMDHLKAACPCRPPGEPQSPKRPIPNPKPQAKRPRPSGNLPQVCRKWNRQEPYMDCGFGEACIYRHVCTKCLASDHAAPKCTAKTSTKFVKYNKD